MHTNICAPIYECITCEKMHTQHTNINKQTKIYWHKQNHENLTSIPKHKNAPGQSDTSWEYSLSLSLLFLSNKNHLHGNLRDCSETSYFFHNLERAILQHYLSMLIWKKMTPKGNGIIRRCGFIGGSVSLWGHILCSLFYSNIPHCKICWFPVAYKM